MERAAHSDGELQCSFCHKPQAQVSKLISSPSDYPRAYICDECVAVCVAILMDDRALAEAHDSTPEPEEGHDWFCHPLAWQFLAAAERWIRQEAVGANAAAEFAAMRSLAMRMMH